MKVYIVVEVHGPGWYGMIFSTRKKADEWIAKRGPSYQADMQVVEYPVR